MHFKSKMMLDGKEKSSQCHMSSPKLVSLVNRKKTKSQIHLEYHWGRSTAASLGLSHRPRRTWGTTVMFTFTTIFEELPGA